MPPVVLGASANIQVSFDSSPFWDRSESSLAVNPLDNLNLAGASKRFFDPPDYGFTLAAYASFDGGSTWSEAPPLQLDPSWGGISDPAVAWDGSGNVFLVTLPFLPGTPPDLTGTIVGIAVYQSSDGGATWGPPSLIHTSPGDDKQGAAGDWNPASPFFGNVYAAWDDGADLAFARTSDSGVTWQGVGGQPVGTPLSVGDSFSPEPTVADDGTVYIVWTSGSDIKFVTSTDGGDSFSAPALVATGITPLSSPPLAAPDGFPELPGAKFRVLTLASATAGIGGPLTAAWADYREGVSRIYYRTSPDGGSTWLGDPSGQPLLTGNVASLATQHDFHAQLATLPSGQIGCAFYELGPKCGSGPSLIDVTMAVSDDGGASFPNRVTVTGQPWDPAVDAPLSHGRPTTTFIGDYFGLAGGSLGFFPFWTDTRTGIQEIFTARVLEC
jgi:hypothetical protein